MIDWLTGWGRKWDSKRIQETEKKERKESIVDVCSSNEN
jgi:hypothetical protein